MNDLWNNCEEHKEVYNLMNKFVGDMFLDSTKIINDYPFIERIDYIKCGTILGLDGIFIEIRETCYKGQNADSYYRWTYYNSDMEDVFPRDIGMNNKKSIVTRYNPRAWIYISKKSIEQIYDYLWAIESENTNANIIGRILSNNLIDGIELI